MGTRARLEIWRGEDTRATAEILTPDGLARSLTELPRLLSAFNNQNYIRRRTNSGSYCSYNRQALEYTHITECSTKMLQGNMEMRAIPWQIYYYGPRNCVR